MSEILSLILILTFKILLIIGFVYLVNRWFSKEYSKLPVYIYWILGLFFVWMLSSHIFLWFSESFLLDNDDMLTDKNSVNSISVILGLLVYIYLGRKYFKKNNK